MSKRHQNKSGSSSRTQLHSSQDGTSNWKVIITTATEVNVWNGINNKYDTVFTSGSEGIVSAKLAKEGNVLAVAGSQVVLLHKLERGQQQSYKLKGADATRLLEYAADGKSIFLNSSLRNSIQTYNVRDDKISESLKSHPSSVTSFATSFDSNLILSASANPPTIHLDNLSLRTTSQLKPQASDQKVILSAFHPTRKNVFMLAFADGVLAAYDYSKASKNGQHIHAFGHLHDAMMGGNGLTAAEFIPGSQTRAITVGEDGKCMILDFDKRSVVGSFRIGAPATCLSIRSDESGKKGSGKWLAAVGTVHGWCYIYDRDGDRIHEVQVDQEGNKVIEVKWKLGDVKLPATSKPAPRKSPQKASNASPLPGGPTPQASKFRQTLPTAQEDPIIPAEKPEVPFQFPESPKLTRMPPPNPNKPLPKAPPKFDDDDLWEEVVDAEFKEQKPAWEDLQNGYTADYMSIFSPVKNEPLRGSPRRSARLSIRSTISPPKESEDKIANLIKRDEEGLLRPSVSSPSLATSKLKSPGKVAVATTGEDLGHIKRSRTDLPKLKIGKKERATLEKSLGSLVRETPEADSNIQEVKPAVPLKDGIKPESPIQRDFAPQPPGITETVEGKENSLTAPTSNRVDPKAERKRIKLEEKERRRSAKEEKKRKKKEGSFPPVSDLVFKDDDMDIDAEPSNLELPSLSPRAVSTKRKAVDDLHDVEAIAGFPKHLPRLAKGKEKAGPSTEPEDIWIPEEVRKPHKRINIGVAPGASPSAIRYSGRQSIPLALHDGTMSLHDMIADLKNTFKEEMAALKTEMRDKFDKQTDFLEGLIKSERSEARALREENERMRAEIEELARFVK
ncbi:hypothetical protein ABW20_dc0100452 [Dactylellina cionopaga]|nr:hypothetical protein ABW20_dc0100452 [Dactylellina cionopaga]